MACIALVHAACSSESEHVCAKHAALYNGSTDAGDLGVDEQSARAVGEVVDDAGPDGFYCTGLLVADQLVITAKHCVFGGGVRFLVGADASRPDGVIDVAETVPHEALDLALLVLDEPAVHLATPIPIFNDVPNASWIGRDVIISGFGQQEDGRIGELEFLGERIIRVDATSITVMGEGESGACLGDSGGPLLIRDGGGSIAVAGVLSKGSASCTGIDIYIRLDVVREWLGQAGVASTRGCESL